MGKTHTLKTFGKRIGNVVLHRLLIAHTNRPESMSHLQSEEVEYRGAALKDAQDYHWNETEKKMLKRQTIEFIRHKRDTKYEDVQFSSSEAEKLVDEELASLLP